MHRPKIRLNPSYIISASIVPPFLYLSLSYANQPISQASHAHTLPWNYASRCTNCVSSSTKALESNVIYFCDVLKKNKIRHQKNKREYSEHWPEIQNGIRVYDRLVEQNQMGPTTDEKQTEDFFLLFNIRYRHYRYKQ
jgi:hypothetical protein